MITFVADNSDITLVQRAITQRVGHELVPGSPAWIRQIKLLDEEIWASMTKQESIDQIVSYGGMAFLEQFAGEFLAIELADA